MTMNKKSTTQSFEYMFGDVIKKGGYLRLQSNCINVKIDIIQ